MEKCLLNSRTWIYYAAIIRLSPLWWLLIKSATFIRVITGRMHGTVVERWLRRTLAARAGDKLHSPPPRRLQTFSRKTEVWMRMKDYISIKSFIEYAELSVYPLIVMNICRSVPFCRPVLRPSTVPPPIHPSIQLRCPLLCSGQILFVE